MVKLKKQFAICLCFTLANCLYLVSASEGENANVSITTTSSSLLANESISPDDKTEGQVRTEPLFEYKQNDRHLSDDKSHKIVANGWPNTSPMWPSVDMADSSSDNNDKVAPKAIPVVQPFIYADKPHANDYSLLLYLNDTLLSMLKRKAPANPLFNADNNNVDNQDSNAPVAVTLSFEYYFNFASNATALPGIRIEVDRKQFKYLEPSLALPDSGANNNIKRQTSSPSLMQVKARMWIGFKERLQVVDAKQFDKHDWLKFSLINRQSPSLVAIRKLRVEFQMSGTADQGKGATTTNNQLPDTVPPGPSTPAVPPQQQQPFPPARNPPGAGDLQPQAPYDYPQPVTPTDPYSNGKRRPAAPPSSIPYDPRQSQPPLQQPPYGAGEVEYGVPGSSTTGGGTEFGPSGGVSYGTPASGAEQSPPLTTAASEKADALASTIKPVDAKKSSWLPSLTSMLPGKRRRRRRRRKREAPSTASRPEVAGPIVLECYRADACEHWKSDTSVPTSGQIQWSLARMPPSTHRVQNGYYYASNRQNYGDANKVFRLSLNQTDMATESDKRGDHCIEIAVYVTEQARLRLYKYTRRADHHYDDSHHDALTLSGSGGGGGGIDNNSNNNINDQEQVQAAKQWVRGPLLLEWSPTLTGSGAVTNGTSTSNRKRLSPNSRIRAIEDDQAGWTLDRLCFGDFFTNSSVSAAGIRADLCGTGECAFGFQMGLAGSGVGESSRTSAADNGVEDDLNYTSIVANDSPHDVEQVVGVALLQEHAINEPFNWPPGGNRWLQTWQRKEVRPQDHWRFFPIMDYDFQPSNVTLLNLFNDANYFIESEWLSKNDHLEFRANLLIEKVRAGPTNSSAGPGAADNGTASSREEETMHGRSLLRDEPMFNLQVVTRLVDSEYSQIYSINSTLEWPPIILLPSSLSPSDASIVQPGSANRQITTTQVFEKNNLSLLYNLSLHLSEHLNEWHKAHQIDNMMFKVVIELRLTIPNSPLAAVSLQQRQVLTGDSQQPTDYRITLANMSLSDRCYPSPCEHGECRQNGTDLNDWECTCDAHYRGRRCEFARWCELVHVTLPNSVATASATPGQQQQQQQQQQVRSVVSSNGQQQQVIVQSSGSFDGAYRTTGRDFCARKLGLGSECSELDLALNDETYSDEGATFRCSCKDDYYLSDDGKCRQAHQCNSIVCPSQTSQYCDETKPFNQTEPCRCNERLDWHRDPLSNRCVRKQCLDRVRDCGFPAHICLPTLPGERPICKCREKFALKTNEKGERYCEPTACVLPTLNDCEQVCVPLMHLQPGNASSLGLPPDDLLERPYRCECHAGYSLNPDGRTCQPTGPKPPHCRSPCQSETQICTDNGCKCKQGFVADGEVTIFKGGSGTNAARPAYLSSNWNSSSGSASGADHYVQSVRCLNKCALSYAENKLEFERIESVCPLGLCDPKTFECSCSDHKSSALVNAKYEPIYESDSDDQLINATTTGAPAQQATTGTELKERKRKSPLCHLRRVCEPNKSIGYNKCRERGAICVPDYTKPATMFDCVCPPGTEKRAATTGGLQVIGASSDYFDFTCEPKCSSIKSECLLKQAVCRLVGKETVKCECLPGFIFDDRDHKCYLARYTYSINLVLANKYYEPASHFRRRRLIPAAKAHQHASNSTGGSQELSAGNEHDNGTAVRPSIFVEEDPQQPLSDLISPTASAAAQIAAPHHHSSNWRTVFNAEYNQCNLTQIIPKAIIDDPYETDMDTYLEYIEQCNERLQDSARMSHLNSRLSEDIRQALRQHLQEFTVTTNQSLCHELLDTQSTSGGVPGAGHYLNCTVYLQSDEKISRDLIEELFNRCDKKGMDPQYCWIKPRLLLRRQSMSPFGSFNERLDLNFRQIIPCELNQFCGDEAEPIRLDDSTSLCSCRCPIDLELNDVKVLYPQTKQQQIYGRSSLLTDAGQKIQYPVAYKEICAPRNHCGLNSTYCAKRPGSKCHYDLHAGSRCLCVYPAYEDSQTGACIEAYTGAFGSVAGGPVGNTLMVVIVLMGITLLVSISLNLYALARARTNLFGHSKQYPLSEFRSAARSASTQEYTQRGCASTNGTGAGNTRSQQYQTRRPAPAPNRLSRSTGVPNLSFTHDDDED